MSENIICFSVGLSQQDIQAGTEAFNSVDQHGNRLETIPLTEDLLPITVGEAIQKTIEKLIEGRETDNPAEFAGATPASSPYRMVLILASEKQQVMQILQSFKKVLPAPRDIIFAMITQTALSWTVEYYIDHLTNEHEQMRDHSPKNDPGKKMPSRSS